MKRNLIKELQLKKAVSRIHNSTDSEHQFSSLCDADDAGETADYLIWDIWAASEDVAYVCGHEEQAHIVEASKTWSFERFTYYAFKLGGTPTLEGKTLTLVSNPDKVLVSAYIQK